MSNKADFTVCLPYAKPRDAQGLGCPPVRLMLPFYSRGGNTDGGKSLFSRVRLWFSGSEEWVSCTNILLCTSCQSSYTCLLLFGLWPWESLDLEHTENCLQLSWNCPHAPEAAAADNYRTQSSQSSTHACPSPSRQPHFWPASWSLLPISSGAN